MHNKPQARRIWRVCLRSFCRMYVCMFFSVITGRKTHKRRKKTHERGGSRKLYAQQATMPCHRSVLTGNDAWHPQNKILQDGLSERHFVLFSKVFMSFIIFLQHHAHHHRSDR